MGNVKHQENSTICPELWSDCDLCKYASLTNTCLYPKSDIEVVIKAAEVAEMVVKNEARESAESIRGTWFEGQDELSPDERMNRFYGYKTQGLNYKEPVKCMDGPTAPGGSSMKYKKSNKGNKPTVYEWGCFK